MHTALSSMRCVTLQNTSVWSLIGENFLQLNVVLQRSFPMVVEDKPVMTLDKLLSQIGGILSLWLGLNIMFVFEIIELVICLIRDRFVTKIKNTATVPHA